MAKKFDTNPLDPEFPERAKELQTQTLKAESGQTRRFAEPAPTEEQTRKLNAPVFEDYVPPQNDSLETTSLPLIPEADPGAKKKHSIGSISLPENVLLMLPYIPFTYIGLIAGIIELIFIPKSEPRVRYHAAQGVAAHLGITLVTMILGVAAIGSDLAEVASFIFGLVTTIMLLVFAYKAWQGKPIHIESVESLTDWLEDKISPSTK